MDQKEHADRGTSFNVWWFTQTGTHGWITRFTSDPAFSGKMAERWRALRLDVLSDEQIDARIDLFAAPLVSGAAERNFQRWKILGLERPLPKPTDYITIKSDTYPEQVSALKRFLHSRAAWMDAHLPTMEP